MEAGAMKDYFIFFKRTLPITLGMIFTLIALCFLVKFYDYGFHFKDDLEYVYFIIFFLIGFPMLMFGINKEAKYESCS
jgi:hypothetical protein